MTTDYTLLKQNIDLIKRMYFSTSPPKFIADIVTSPSSLKDFLTALSTSSDITTKSGGGKVYYNSFIGESDTRPTKTVTGGNTLVLDTAGLADINCINLINDSGDGNIAFKNYMYNLYAWYDRCSSLNWGKTYTTALVPNMSSEWTGITFSQSSNTNPVMKLSDITNAYVTRRILRLFIMLGNLYIAQKKGDDILVNDCYQLLRSTNLAVYGSNSADLSRTVGYNLNSVIQQRLDNYKRGQLRVSTIDKIIATHKNNLKQSSTLLKDSKITHRRQMVIEAIAVASFISIAAGAAAVVVYPMDQNSRYVGCLVVIALSIINALVMNSLRSQGTNVVERFTTLNSDITASMDEAVTYARNTLILANLLDTFRAVGNINYSMTKEANYYNDASEQLLNANLKVRSVYNISYSQDVKFGALINLLTSLSFVVAGMVTLYVSSESMVDKSPMIQKYILILGGVISAICFAIFTLEISTRVHTDPKKIYWGQPSSNVLP